MNLRNTFVAILLSLAIATINAEPVSTGWANNTAIGGHDIVAYHESSPQKGSKSYLVKWNGADWRFASQESADKFAANPELYKPQYNGFCSNGLSLNEGLIPTNGKVYEFFDGKLHMFFSERGRKRWLEGDWKQYKKEADDAWNQLKNQS